MTEYYNNNNSNESRVSIVDDSDVSKCSNTKAVNVAKKTSVVCVRTCVHTSSVQQPYDGQMRISMNTIKKQKRLSVK